MNKILIDIKKIDIKKLISDVRYIGIAFTVLFLVQVLLSLGHENYIEENTNELYKKREILSTLTRLENRWSKKAQADELTRVYKLLNVFDVIYTLKEKKNLKTLSMDLKSKNANKIISLILNANIHVKKLKIEKIDEFTVNLVVKIL